MPKVRVTWTLNMPTMIAIATALVGGATAWSKTQFEVEEQGRKIASLATVETVMQQGKKIEALESAQKDLSDYRRAAEVAAARQETIMQITASDVREIKEAVKELAKGRK